MKQGVWVMFRKEWTGYAATPAAFVFMVGFLVLSGLLTFYPGMFYERGEADLDAFFMWHPWLYLFLVPALTMRLWAEEYKSGTVEILMTLPLSVGQMVLGKFLAAWGFVAITLAGTLPMWLTVSYLGDPDHGVVAAGYVGSLLVAGGYLAMGLCMSAITRNQIVAFVLAVLVCLLFTLTGYPMVIGFFTGWLPQSLLDVLSGFSLLTHFDDARKGILEWNTVFYLATLMGFWLCVTRLAVAGRRA